ncbi:PepSY domain-containing protein [Sphingopyxis sp.]|uniref:PepSY-associated TM helix domain-containing protein n=1 Tax=Sphingopyxis sp. TaxID=1908224 RepID=UPI001D402933|nr:PepSY-associated TM helix domain-containing protein [Sphingopyxis sp.]MBW8297357.1 PepSY domain-containing protein [Sphingopyxis sp.]
MTLAISKGAVQRALSGHAAIGLLASALLYVICLTGTVVVFYQEWQRIEQPGAPEMAAIAPDAVQAGVAEVLRAEKGKPATTHLYVHMPVNGLPRTTITTDHQAFHVDADGKIAGPEENAWSEFLLGAHYALNIPGLVGMTIVGIFGVMILALALSGIVAHPRIFRDAFRLRARDNHGVGLADWHNRLSVWTLPFSLAIALTGAMIGLGVVGTYGLAAAFYKNDVEAAYAPIFGEEHGANASPAPLANVAAPLAWLAQNHPDVRPTYVILHDPGTRGQHIQIVAEHPRRLIYGETYEFGADGTYHGKVGLSDGHLGQQLAASTYNLHFGNYGGLPVKIIYFLLGLALTIVVATGTSIWLGKRERRGVHDQRLRSLWDGVLWGVPLALTLTFLARLIAGNAAPLTAIFWLLCALILLIAAIRPQPRPKRLLQWLFGASLLASPVAVLLA